MNKLTLQVDGEPVEALELSDETIAVLRDWREFNEVETLGEMIALCIEFTTGPEETQPLLHEPEYDEV